MTHIKTNAFAKINIGLYVGQKGEDGFHDIKSIFSCVSLCDSLTVRMNDLCCLNLQCFDMTLPKDNTIARAFDAFCDYTGSYTGFDVFLKKRIPQGAGLGGGSSDAASFVLAACKLCNMFLEQKVLDKISSSIGSDVFFFLRQKDEGKNNCAIVTGRGDEVFPIEKRRDLHFLLAFPNVLSGTKKAYQMLDLWYLSHAKNESPLQEQMQSQYMMPPSSWQFLNDFTAPISFEYDIIKKIIKDMKEQGAAFCDMSGSGSCVFGVFLSKREAKKAQKMIFFQEKNIKCIYCN